MSLDFLIFKIFGGKNEFSCKIGLDLTLNTYDYCTLSKPNNFTRLILFFHKTVRAMLTSNPLQCCLGPGVGTGVRSNKVKSNNLHKSWQTDRTTNIGLEMFYIPLRLRNVSSPSSGFSACADIISCALLPENIPALIPQEPSLWTHQPVISVYRMQGKPPGPSLLSWPKSIPRAAPQRQLQ